jgi:hypothetical protein
VSSTRYKAGMAVLVVLHCIMREGFYADQVSNRWCGLFTHGRSHHACCRVSSDVMTFPFSDACQMAEFWTSPDPASLLAYRVGPAFNVLAISLYLVDTFVLRLMGLGVRGITVRS